MKYILKHNNYYFVSFDESWPTWMTDIKNAKRYNTKEAAEEDNAKIFKLLKYKCEIVEI